MIMKKIAVVVPRHEHFVNFLKALPYSFHKYFQEVNREEQAAGMEFQSYEVLECEEIPERLIAMVRSRVR